MQIAGIIAEYDPFHNGHAWQICEAKRRGAEMVIVVMSSGVTQRGSLPLLPEAVRAKAALLAGADLVLELPAPCACSGAEAFAAAGVALLATVGCDTLMCGAETAASETALAAARILKSSGYTTALKAALADGARNFAAAREQAFAQALAAESCGRDPNLCQAEALCALLHSPNDNLAVEYAKAILQQKDDMALCVLPRVGARHNGRESGAAEGKNFASASRLRALWQEKGASAAAHYVPSEAESLYAQAECCGMDIDRHAADLVILSRLRSAAGTNGSGHAFARVRGVSEGLEHALENAVHAALTVEALCDALTSVRYPRARMRRLVWNAALHIPNDFPVMPPYVHILGARRTALPLLKGSVLPVSSSLQRLAQESALCARFAGIQADAIDLAALCRRAPGPMGQAYTTPCVFL